MTDPAPPAPGWEGFEEHYRRIGEANRRATEEYLRSLTVEESIEIFEDLCEGFPELRDRPPLPRDPPVPLFRIWKA